MVLMGMGKRTTFAVWVLALGAGTATFAASHSATPQPPAPHSAPGAELDEDTETEPQNRNELERRTVQPSLRHLLGRLTCSTFETEKWSLLQAVHEDNFGEPLSLSAAEYGQMILALFHQQRPRHNWGGQSQSVKKFLLESMTVLRILRDLDLESFDGQGEGDGSLVADGSSVADGSLVADGGAPLLTDIYTSHPKLAAKLTELRRIAMSLRLKCDAFDKQAEIEPHLSFVKVEWPYQEALTVVHRLPRTPFATPTRMTEPPAAFLKSGPEPADATHRDATHRDAKLAETVPPAAPAPAVPTGPSPEERARTAEDARRRLVAQKSISELERVLVRNSKRYLERNKKGEIYALTNKKEIILKKEMTQPLKSCFRYVKAGLLQASWVDSYFNEESAKDAETHLLEANFRKTKITDPRLAPRGSVLVYGGGEHGHIEVRVQGGFLSDYLNPEPRTGNSRIGHGNGRYLKGIYVLYTEESPEELALLERRSKLSMVEARAADRGRKSTPRRKGARK